MAYIELADTELDSGITDNRVASFMKKYRDSEKIYDHWKDKYEDYKLVLFLHMEDGQTLKLDQKYQINKNQLLMNN